MEEMKLKMKEIGCLKDRLLDAAKQECCDNGSIEKAGLIVDMVKDLSEVEKNCAKSMYYACCVKDMKEQEQMPEEARAGYNPNRYASGRYAPAGHGNFTRGYIPEYMMNNSDDRVMGYTPTGNNDRTMGYTPTGNNDRMGYPQNNSRYGYPYSQYVIEKRHYHESHDPQAKGRMDEHIREHVADSVDTIYEMYQEADPEMKKKIKEKINTLITNIRE